jgi:hypothetical protein
MASKNDWKCERVFEDADDGLINFSYELLTQTELPLVVPLSRFRQADSQAVTHRASIRLEVATGLSPSGSCRGYCCFPLASQGCGPGLFTSSFPLRLRNSSDGK